MNNSLRFLDRFGNTTAYKQLLADTRSKKFTAAFGLHKNEKPFVLSDIDCFAVVVMCDYVEAQQTIRDLAALGRNFEYLPHKEDVLLFRSEFWQDAVRRRNAVLHNMLHRNLDGIVVCAEGLLQPLPPVDFFAAATFTLEQGCEIDFATLAAHLVKCGYKRVDAVEGIGEFAVRGDIIDITTPSARFRLDFWGDGLESISLLNADMTGSTKTSKIQIFPLTNTQGADQNLIAQLSQKVAKLAIEANAKTRLATILSELSACGEVVDNGWLAPFLPHSSLSDYLPCDCLVVWDEPKLIEERTRFLYREHDERIAHLLEVGEVTASHMAAFVDRFAVFEAYKKFTRLAFESLESQHSFFRSDSVKKFSSTAITSYHNRLDDLKKDVKNWNIAGYQIALLCGNTATKDAVSRQLNDLGIFMSTEDICRPNAAEGLILPITVNHGFISHTNRLVVLGVTDIFGRAVSKVSKTKKSAFLSVEKGDFVVHDFHGIGLCQGIVKVDTDGSKKDYIEVLYKGGDKLYVPVENSNLLTRFSGGENPALSRLGGQEFERVKAKVRQSIKEMSVNLLELYSQRQKKRGHTYQVDSYLLQEFSNAFPFVETDDQLKCIEEINADLTDNKIMDRLLVGDVGFGKTEVAMRAAFAVVASGFQAAVLVPTTILSEQHFHNFENRMKDFDFKVAVLNRFRSAAEQKEILKQLAEGKIDIIIGTHRLLSKDVKFPKLGLLVLDEEQRFGVEHKEHLKNLKSNVDVLTLTATPIPRTLHMSLSGIRDISTITTPPNKRQAVQTFVVEESRELIRDIINREISRGGQVYLLYNRVQTIERFASEIQQLVPNARVIVAHGQMERLEDAIINFQKGQSNVLICTTIIENGIDIPNANSLIVMNADKFGLSQLYQLRGRVGRSDRLAYAYFLYESDKILTSEAFKRLASITQYSELGSGFRIALKDLEIRGAGNLLGREQHGHMLKVGYDMYARMLKESMSELKGEVVEKETDCQVESDIEAYAAETYIVSSTERMDFYQRLAFCRTLDEVNTLSKQVNEVFGAAPKPVQNLFKIAQLKCLAAECNVKKLVIRRNIAILEFSTKQALLRREVVEAIAMFGKFAKFDAVEPSIVFSGQDFLQYDRLLTALWQFLEKILLSTTKN